MMYRRRGKQGVTNGMRQTMDWNGQKMSHEVVKGEGTTGSRVLTADTRARTWQKGEKEQTSELDEKAEAESETRRHAAAWWGRLTNQQTLLESLCLAFNPLTDRIRWHLTSPSRRPHVTWVGFAPGGLYGHFNMMAPSPCLTESPLLGHKILIVLTKKQALQQNPNDESIWFDSESCRGPFSHSHNTEPVRRISWPGTKRHH